MARSRSIKPSFFEDTKIADISIPARLLYIGLWTMMDSNGICENDARLIKFTIFRYDEKLTIKAVQSLIVELINMGLLVVIDHNNMLYLYSKKFKDHQHFHRDEKPKYLIPQGIINDAAPDTCLHRTGTVPAPHDASARTPVICNLESVINNQIADARDLEKSRPNILLEIWNKNCGQLPKIKIMNALRNKLSALALIEIPDEKDWEKIVKFISSSDFYVGKNKSGWKAGFDFILQKGKALELLEKADNTNSKNSTVWKTDL